MFFLLSLKTLFYQNNSTKLIKRVLKQLQYEILKEVIIKQTNKESKNLFFDSLILNLCIVLTQKELHHTNLPQIQQDYHTFLLLHTVRHYW